MPPRPKPTVSAASAFEFITLTTGGTTVSPRSDVEPKVIGIIQAALRRDGTLWAGWSVRTLPTPAGGRVFEMAHHQIPLSRCWLCIDASASDAMWEVAEQAAPPTVVLHRPRGVPWLAIALLPGAIQSALAAPGVLMELGDAERCVAWALLS